LPNKETSWEEVELTKTTQAKAQMAKEQSTATIALLDLAPRTVLEGAIEP
jgi:hypothetical protein